MNEVWYLDVKMKSLSPLTTGDVRKSLNGNLPMSKLYHFLQLHPLHLIYEGKVSNQQGVKKDHSKIYAVRGFQGRLRQQFLADIQKQDIEPCQRLSDERYLSAQFSFSEEAP
ncbi:MAG: hypothetical protein ACFFGZ_10245 [Candidatus Thorarchaeota archaeon]